MKRMASNFPHAGGMDIHLANMRALLQVRSPKPRLFAHLNSAPSQIFDPELFELMQQNGDYTHFYFAYRWFLLDFKRGTFFILPYKAFQNFPFRTPLRRRFSSLGDHLGRQSRGHFPFHPFLVHGYHRILSRYPLGQQHGLYRCYQILQR